MFRRKLVPCLALCQILGLYAAASLPAQETSRTESTEAAESPQASPSNDDVADGSDADGNNAGAYDPTTRPSLGATGSLIESIGSPALQDLIVEVLERNPEIARAARLAIVAETKAPQLRALPDPVAALALFVLPPETRTGPQRASVSIAQRIPWFGKLALREQAALYAAAAARAEVEATRLDKLTATRKLAHELAFLDAYEAIVGAERNTLVRYEKAAQARYASGTGMQQEVFRIQAQITRTDTRLLEIAERRSALTANFNRLRDRPAMASIDGLGANDPIEPIFDGEALRAVARSYRPELVAAEARIAAGSTLVDLAEKSFGPDITFGLSYTAVARRDDTAGRVNPPDGNGDDILALTGSLNLPVWRKKLEAGVEEARASRWASEEGKRIVLADIDSRIGDLTTRMPLLFEHLSLLETVLYKQAREALRSAENGYRTGRLNAVELLDSEVVLFEVQIAAARTRADLAVAWAELERAIGHPAHHPIEGSKREQQP